MFMEINMDKMEFILKVFSIFPDIPLSHFQVQKLFFLIEKRLYDKYGNKVKYFNFEPYYYGPFDENLTHYLDICTDEGYLLASKNNQINYYRLNKSKTVDVSNFLDSKAREYIKNKLVEFIRNVRFKELCFSIYEEFPEMAKNSIFLRR